jgi:CRP-like cAMP-binding protein
VSNPLFSDVPAICTTHHFLRSPKQKRRLCEYLLATVRELERYEDADLLEISNHVDAVRLRQGDSVLRPEEVIDKMFLVYSGCVEELRGRIKIDWPEGSLFKLSLLESKTLKKSASSFVVKSKDCVVLTVGLAKVLDMFDAHFRNKIVAIQDHMGRLPAFSHLDLNTLDEILAAGVSIARSKHESSLVSPELVLLGQTVQAIYWLDKGRLKKTTEVEDSRESVIPVVACVSCSIATGTRSS